MEMSETPLKADLTGQLRRDLDPMGAVVLRHEDKITYGVPDISITCRVRTVWLEVKFLRSFAPKHRHFNGKQTLMMLKLGAAGLAWFVYYVEDPIRTLVVHPTLHHKFDREEIASGELLALPPLADGNPQGGVIFGFDHRAVVKYVWGRL